MTTTEKQYNVAVIQQTTQIRRQTKKAYTKTNSNKNTTSTIFAPAPTRPTELHKEEDRQRKPTSLHDSDSQQRKPT